jgi:peroxin-1
VVNQFLCELDGVEVLSNVTILAASSRPELIDPALLRPGRIDKKVYIGFPDEAERTEILTGLMGKVEAGELDVSSIASIDGLTGADYQGIVHELQLDLIHERITEITTENLLEKAQNAVPSVGPAERRRYE